ncbi:putative porin [bacterium]
MIKKMLVVFLLLGFLVGSVSAKGVSLLVDKLKDKGVLTQAEVDDIWGHKEGHEKPCKSWIKFSGYFRLRYQRDELMGYDRDRFRMMFKLKGKTEIAEDLKLGFGIATGDWNPRSRNVTMDYTFEKKMIMLDHVYVKKIFPEVLPDKTLKLIAGKFSNKKFIWKPTDMLWDTDINIEGVGAHLKCEKTDWDLFLNTGLFVMDHRGSEGNATMFLIQPVAMLDVGELTRLKVAASYYHFDDAKGNTYLYSPGSNSVDLYGNLTNDFNPIVLAAKMVVDDWFLWWEQYGFFGEYVLNPDPSSDNQGFSAGVFFGPKKIKETGECKLKLMFRELQKDAWLDVLPDLDAMGGMTDSQGIELIFKYGIAKNTYLAFDYYRMGNIGKSNKKDLVQIDLGMKF